MGNIPSKMGSFFSKVKAVLWTHFSHKQISFLAGEPKISKYAQISAELRCQTIRVPNLDPMFKDWPMGTVNPNYQRLKPFANRKIDR
jgi:hypothetical protein